MQNTYAWVGDSATAPSHESEKVHSTIRTPDGIFIFTRSLSSGVRLSGIAKPGKSIVDTLRNPSLSSQARSLAQTVNLTNQCIELSASVLVKAGDGWCETKPTNPDDWESGETPTGSLTELVFLGIPQPEKNLVWADLYFSERQIVLDDEEEEEIRTVGYFLSSEGKLYESPQSTVGHPTSDSPTLPGSGETHPLSSPSLIPTRFPSKQRISSVSAGEGWLCCVSVEGELFTWGNNTYGQLAVGHRKELDVPTRVVLKERVSSVSAGTYHMFALTISHRVLSCGDNVAGQLGRGQLCEEGDPQLREVSFPELERDTNTTSAGPEAASFPHAHLVVCADDRSFVLFSNTRSHETSSASPPCCDALFACGNNYDGALGLGPSTGKWTSHTELVVSQMTKVSLPEGNIEGLCIGEEANMTVFMKDGGVIGWGEGRQGAVSMDDFYEPTRLLHLQILRRQQQIAPDKRLDTRMLSRSAVYLDVGRVAEEVMSDMRHGLYGDCVSLLPFADPPLLSADALLCCAVNYLLLFLAFSLPRMQFRVVDISSLCTLMDELMHAANTAVVGMLLALRDVIQARNSSLEEIVVCTPACNFASTPACASKGVGRLYTEGWSEFLKTDLIPVASGYSYRSGITSPTVVNVRVTRAYKKALACLKFSVALSSVYFSPGGKGAKGAEQHFNKLRS